MSFARPDLVWLSVALPVVVLAAVHGYHRRLRRVAAALGDAALVGRLGVPRPGRFPAGRGLVVAAAAAALGLAAAGPRWGVQAAEGGAPGRDVVLVLDVSRSMMVRDVEPNRMERQRLLARHVVRELDGARIGLAAFAGRAFILSPLTVDRSALALYLDALDPDVVSQGGSSLAAAVRQGTDLALQGREERGGHRTVVLISDGEAHEDPDAVLAAAARAERAGVVIHTVTIGTTRGGPVPVEDHDGRTTGYMRYQGEMVISRADPDLMERIAARTGGRAFRLDQPGATNRLIAAIRTGGGAVGDAAGDVRYVPRDRFRWFAAFALLLLAADALRAAGAAPAAARREA